MVKAALRSPEPPQERDAYTTQRIVLTETLKWNSIAQSASGQVDEANYVRQRLELKEEQSRQGRFWSPSLITRLAVTTVGLGRKG
jgi:hypothetical protein